MARHTSSRSDVLVSTRPGKIRYATLVAQAPRRSRRPCSVFTQSALTPRNRERAAGLATHAVPAGHGLWLRPLGAPRQVSTKLGNNPQPYKQSDDAQRSSAANQRQKGRAAKIFTQKINLIDSGGIA